jgi:hypothetical protein
MPGCNPEPGKNTTNNYSAQEMVNDSIKEKTITKRNSMASFLMIQELKML